MRSDIINDVGKAFIQSLMHAYLQGIMLYAKGSAFDNLIRFHDADQTDKYSHNFLFINQDQYDETTIQQYLTFTKPYGFSQFLTFSSQQHIKLQSYLHGHQPLVGSWSLMVAPINILNNLIKSNDQKIKIESIVERNASTFLSFNFALG